ASRTLTTDYTDEKNDFAYHCRHAEFPLVHQQSRVEISKFALRDHLSREREQGAARWPSASADFNQQRRRTALSDQRRPDDTTSLRHRRGRMEARRNKDSGPKRFRLSGPQPFRHQARRVLGAGTSSSLRNLQTLRRPHGQAADGPRRRTAVEPRARQSLQHAETDPHRRQHTASFHRAGPSDSADRAAERHEVHQAHSNSERAPNKVLGSPDAPRRARPPAGRIRHASRSSLSARDLPRALSRRHQRFSRDAARSESQA